LKGFNDFGLFQRHYYLRMPWKYVLPSAPFLLSILVELLK
jgi:hypothetical protein